MEREINFYFKKAGSLDNYMRKEIFCQTRMNAFLWLDYSQFIKQISFVKQTHKRAGRNTTTNGKLAKKEVAKKKDDRFEAIQENNMLFKNNFKEAEVSEVEDPQNDDRRRSEKFLGHKDRTFHN